MEITTEVVTITPEIAEALIQATGTANFRRTCPVRVATIAQDIADGLWELNGETIKLNGSIVLDGLHRLHAVRKANRPIRSLVVRGLNKDVSGTVDRIRARTLSQWLEYKKVPNAINVATITRHWYAAQTGGWKSDGPRPASESRLLKFYEQNAAQIASAISVIGGGNAPRPTHFLPYSVLGPILCEGTSLRFATPAHSETARLYVKVLRTGETATVGDPVAQLRNRMIANGIAHAKMPRRSIRALAIHAWNLYAAGDTVRVLKYILSGPKQRSFPDIAQATY